MRAGVRFTLEFVQIQHLKAQISNTPASGIALAHPDIRKRMCILYMYTYIAYAIIQYYLGKM